MEYMIGEISPVGFSYAPRNWASCDGQLIAISSNQAMYALLGTQFGGDGRITFGLPDLRGRAAIGDGSGPGLPSASMGQSTGLPYTHITTNQMPLHSHTAVFTPQGGGGTLKATATVNAKAGVGDANDAANNTYWATPTGGRSPATTGFSTSKDVTLASDAVTVDLTGSSGITGGTVQNVQSGGTELFPTQSPSLTTNYIICTVGMFPARN